MRDHPINISCFKLIYIYISKQYTLKKQTPSPDMLRKRERTERTFIITNKYNSNNE